MSSLLVVYSVDKWIYIAMQNFIFVFKKIPSSKVVYSVDNQNQFNSENLSNRTKFLLKDFSYGR
jgi:hypothetical protein